MCGKAYLKIGKVNLAVLTSGSRSKLKSDGLPMAGSHDVDCHILGCHSLGFTLPPHATYRYRYISVSPCAVLGEYERFRGRPEAPCLREIRSFVHQSVFADVDKFLSEKPIQHRDIASCIRVPPRTLDLRYLILGAVIDAVGAL